MVINTIGNYCNISNFETRICVYLYILIFIFYLMKHLPHKCIDTQSMREKLDIEYAIKFNSQIIELQVYKLILEPKRKLIKLACKFEL